MCIHVWDAVHSLTVDRCSKTAGNVAHAKNFNPDKRKYYGRFNQGVVTLNLVDVACSSGKDEKKFWELMDERLKLCYRALMCRHKRLLGTKSDVAPILWQNGALARLKRARLSIRYYLTDIQQFRLDTQVFANVYVT